MIFRHLIFALRTFQMFNEHGRICRWSEISYSFSHTMFTTVW